jgi:hypothetical protein
LTLPTPPSSSDPTNFPARADAFLGALPDFEADMTAKSVAATSAATTASTAAATAAAAAAAAAASASAAEDADSTQTTSTTSLTITASASRTFLSVGTGLAFTDGMYLLAASDANPNTHWMSGRVTSYSGSTLIVAMDDAPSAALGATRADWIISKATQAGRAPAVLADIYAATANVSMDPATFLSAAAYQAVTYSASPSWDVLTKGYKIKITLTGNIAIPAPSVLRDGVTYQIKLKQDGTGGRTVSWDTIYDWGDAGPPDINDEPNIVSLFAGEYDADDSKIYMTHRRGA